MREPGGVSMKPDFGSEAGQFRSRRRWGEVLRLNLLGEQFRRTVVSEGPLEMDSGWCGRAGRSRAVDGGGRGGGEGWLEAICPEPSASLYGGGSADFGAAPVEAELGPERVFVA